MTFDLQGPAGRLEALVDAPASAPRAAVVLAHPHPEYGGTMRARVLHAAMLRGLSVPGARCCGSTTAASG